MAEVKDPALATALRQAKTQPMFFAFVAKGSSDGVLMLAKKKVPAKEVAEAKAASGGKTVYRGRCKGEGGSLLFELADPPGTLAKQLKAVIHESTGMTLAVETRDAGDLETEGDETSGEQTSASSQKPSPPPVPPRPSAAPKPPGARQAMNAVIKRLNAMSAKIKPALAGPNKARVRTLFGSVNGLIKKKDPDATGKVLDQLEPLLNASSAIPPASPSPAGALIKRLNSMTGAIKAALTGPNKARVPSLFVMANRLIKSGDYTKAGKAVDALALVVKSAPTGPAPPKSAAPSDKASQQAEWERRVIAVEPKVREAQKKRAGEAKWMTMFNSVQDLGGEGEFTKAFAILDKLEALLRPAGGEVMLCTGTNDV